MVKLLFTLCLYSIREPGRSFEEDRMNAIGHGFTPTSGHASAIGAGAHMSEVIDLFRRDPQLRALAVVDGDDRPSGIIPAQPVREPLFCLFWFSLMPYPPLRVLLASMVDPWSNAALPASS